MRIYPTGNVTLTPSEKITTIAPLSIQVFDKDRLEVMRITTEGEVFWLKDGVLTKAVMDEELAQAFSYCITVIAGFNADELIKKIKIRPTNLTPGEYKDWLYEELKAADLMLAEAMANKPPTKWRGATDPSSDKPNAYDKMASQIYATEDEDLLTDMFGKGGKEEVKEYYKDDYNARVSKVAEMLKEYRDQCNSKKFWADTRSGRGFTLGWARRIIEEVGK